MDWSRPRRRVARLVPAQGDAARAAVEQSTARYQAGLATVVEVAEAQRLLAQAEIDDALAKMAGMTPIALGPGESGEQSAPLGRAVIGGLALATFATLTVLSSVYAILQRKGKALAPGRDPLRLGAQPQARGEVTAIAGLGRAGYAEVAHGGHDCRRFGGGAADRPR
jgi:hypothetical protein